MTDVPRAWLTRSGRYGERDAWALDDGVTPGGFGEVADLSGCRKRDEVRAKVAEAYPEAAANTVTAFAAQLWTLVGRMQVGDFVVLPLKTTSQVAVGRITGPYKYRAGESDRDRRHVRPVEWLRTDIARPAIKQDLLYTLGAFSTYCEVARNEAAARIAGIVATGADPGTKPVLPPMPKTEKQQVIVEDTAPEDEAAIDVEEYAQDRIRALLQEGFAGHRMAVLVEALLTAQGYTCWRAPEGADGGVDLLAGSGPLGLDAPQLVVQVKSEQGPVGDPVISQLLGTTSKHGGAAQGLLVAWGGLTGPARKSARDNYFRLRVWEATDVIAQLTRHYDQLPEEIRTDLPLKRIWVAVEERP